MEKTRHIVNAFLAGVGGAFVMFPATNSLDRFLSRDSVQERMHQNFKRVGDSLNQAMGKVAREQERQP